MKTFELINIGSTFLKIKNIQTYRLDSEILLSKALKKKREDIIVDFDKEVKLDEISEFKYLINRRSSKEPIAYILKEKEFWSKNFYVDRNALIPRPETEIMIDKLVKIYGDKTVNILDIGTGSGCIIISLITEIANSKGVGIDISKNAIKIARKNMNKFNLNKRIKLFNRSFDQIYDKKFDLIVANLPYIKKSELRNLDVGIKNFEPKIALDGGNDGLDLIKKVIYKTKNILKVNGMLALEIGNGQFKPVSKILLRNNFKVEYKLKDYKNNVRCILSKKLNKLF